MISIICATRGRPQFMERFYQSAQSAQTPPEFIWFIDEDDITSQDQAKKLNTKFVTRPKGSIVLSDAINVVYPECKEDIIFCAGDDLIFRTPKWDIYVEEAFSRYKDKILLCGGDDGYNKDLLTHFFLHRNWINCIGRVVPPYFRDCYVDTWMNEVARLVGRWEKLPIMIEHMHFSIGKSEYDNTAKERMELIQKGDESGQTFLRTKPERISEANKLLYYIRNFHEQSRKN